MAYRLDDFVRLFGLKKPNELKIDVDGGELEVVEGAQNTLRDGALRSVLIELDENISSYTKVVSLVEGSGFKLSSKHPRIRPNTFNYIFERN